MQLIPRRLIAKLAENLPARNIKHPTGDPDGRPYLRRYYVGTLLGIRFYIHHFVDSDPDGLHNHPWRYGGSLVLADYYFEERRHCLGHNARRIRFINFVNGDTLHRVIVPDELKAVYNIHYEWQVFTDAWRLGVWTLFWHTRKVMPWATIKDKGTFKQYYEEQPSFTLTAGHSDWWKKAAKGKYVFPVSVD